MNVLRQEYYTLYQYFWQSQTSSDEFDLHPIQHFREYEVSETNADACRFVGTFMARKSPGNLHVTTGKQVSHYFLLFKNINILFEALIFLCFYSFRALGVESNVHIHLAPLNSDGSKFAI